MIYITHLSVAIKQPPPHNVHLLAHLRCVCTHSNTRLLEWNAKQKSRATSSNGNGFHFFEKFFLEVVIVPQHTSVCSGVPPGMYYKNYYKKKKMSRVEGRQFFAVRQTASLILAKPE